MRKMGISDAYMYYCNAGHAGTMEIKIPMILAREADPEKLSQAAAEALAYFPEFAVRPVVSGGIPMLESNPAPVKVITAPDDGSLVVNYGTDELNGHVLFLHVDSADARRVTFCYYHAMSDFVGGMALLKEILYRYGLLTGQAEEQTADVLEASGIRTCVPADWDREENLDPYTHFARKPENAPAPSPFIPAFTPGMEIYPQGSDFNHIYHVHLSTEAFHHKAKELGTSFAPLLTCVLSDACAQAFGPCKEPIVVHFPVDIRRIYGCDTITNFSDGVRFTIDEKTRELPLAERAAVFTQTMKDQRTKEHMDPFLYEKAEQTRSFLNDPDGYLNVSRKLTTPPPADAPSPVTFGITYPGRLDMPDFLRGMLTHVGVESVINLSKLFSIVSTYGDSMTIQSVQRYDGDEMPKAIVSVLDGIGIKASYTDLGVRHQDCMDPSLLKQV